VALSDPRRSIPRTDDVLADPRVSVARDRLNPDELRAAVQTVQQLARDGHIRPEDVVDHVVAGLPIHATTLRPVINATGVIVHTNLGRAPLSSAAKDAIQRAAGYVDIEYDVATGSRARRGAGATDALLAAVRPADTALVVNNNAAALALVATALAAGRDIVISRGEMVEIGDGFRLPDLLTSTGARLREVGTTNRTTVDDYKRALGPDTAFLLKVHPSNFVIDGFVSSASVEDLAKLGPPVVVDIGSGLLAPDPLLPDEPDAASTLRDGAAIVTASGDKLLGGPQAGVILGRRDFVEQVRRHPLARAMRTDKLTLAALEATLRGPQPPVTIALHADVGELMRRADRLAVELSGAGIDATPVQSAGEVGGGGAPGVTLPSAAVSLPAGFAAELRRTDPPVIGRLDHDRCLLDLRAVPADDDADLVKAVVAAGGHVT
jgi:L-seryl-tRNA(Ser) seleniumtransferase